MDDFLREADTAIWISVVSRFNPNRMWFRDVSRLYVLRVHRFRSGVTGFDFDGFEFWWFRAYS